MVAGRPRVEAIRRWLSKLDLPPLALAYLIACLAAAIAWAVFSFADLDTSSGQWGRTLLLAVLALGFEEGTARAARLRIRFGNNLTQDLTSVWSFGAVIALPAGWAIALIAVIFVYVRIRQDRPAKRAGIRTLFDATNVALSCLTAQVVISTLHTLWGGLPWSLDSLFPIALGMVVYASLNRALVTGFMLCRGVPLPDLIGTQDQNLIEFATLCLGGLSAIAVIHEPSLVVLVIAPMIALQRGARLREIEIAATTDTKTGLLNAIAWEQVAQQEVARTTRNGTSLAVLIVDIDRFKLVNDKFGHLAGDRVLREVGHCLRSELREYDTVGRFGGEEFVAVLPEADDMDALIAAERLRSRVNSLDLTALLTEAHEQHEMSVSVGVAVFPRHGRELAELLREADAALYKAKAAGRNQVMLAERGRGTPSMQPVLGS